MYVALYAMDGLPCGIYKVMCDTICDDLYCLAS